MRRAVFVLVVVSALFGTGATAAHASGAPRATVCVTVLVGSCADVPPQLADQVAGVLYEANRAVAPYAFFYHQGDGPYLVVYSSCYVYPQPPSDRATVTEVFFSKDSLPYLSGRYVVDVTALGQQSSGTC